MRSPWDTGSVRTRSGSSPVGRTSDHAGTYLWIASAVTIAILGLAHWKMPTSGPGHTLARAATAWGMPGLNVSDFRMLILVALLGVAAGSVCIPILSFFGTLRKLELLRRLQCPRCAYPAGGASICPECGLVHGAMWKPVGRWMLAVRTVSLSCGLSVGMVTLLHASIPLEYQADIGIDAIPFFLHHAPSNPGDVSRDPGPTLLIRCESLRPLRLGENPISFREDLPHVVAISLSVTAVETRFVGTLKVPDAAATVTDGGRDELYAASERLRSMDDRIGGLPVDDVARRLAEELKRSADHVRHAAERLRAAQQPSQVTFSTPSGSGPLWLTSTAGPIWSTTPRATAILLAIFIVIAVPLAAVLHTLADRAAEFPWPADESPARSIRQQ